MLFRQRNLNMDWLYSLSGFLVGLVVGVTGVGGGSLMTPLLVLVFGVAPVTAVGTDLLFAALTKTGGAWAHARRDRKSTRLNSSHSQISYAVFCLKKKKEKKTNAESDLIAGSRDVVT